MTFAIADRGTSCVQVSEREEVRTFRGHGCGLSHGHEQGHKGAIRRNTVDLVEDDVDPLFVRVFAQINKSGLLNTSRLKICQAGSKYPIVVELAEF